MRKFLTLSFVLFFYIASGAAEQKKTICLNMIVKDESTVITRCLTSLLPLIDYWVIVDTGSTDGTQDVIKNFMKEKSIPGELHERPWKNFEHNRNEALDLARNKTDYILFIDADEYLVYEPDFKLPPLDKDYYHITMSYGGMNYGKIMLIKNHKDWRWVGVLHEAVYPPLGSTCGQLEKVVNIYTTEGARSRDPQKYQKDALVLEEAVKKEPDNSRYVFYLAQSYRDAREYELALKNYEKRAAMGGWDQEVFWSLYQIGLLQEALQRPPSEFISSYIKAFQYRPSRPEPLYQLANYYQRNGNYETGYKMASLGMKLPPSNDILFLQQWMYDYGIPLELSICAYWLGKFDECQHISLELLKKKDIPENVRICVQQNLGFANANILEQIKTDATLKELGNITPERKVENKTVLLAILARNKAHTLPKYLDKIEKIDYDKNLISVYINTNNNQDETLQILKDWKNKNENQYRHVILDDHNVDQLSETRPHEWTSERFKALRNIRNKSLQKTKELGCDYYFVVDCDNFIEPSTLKELIKKDKPIIAPMLTAVPVLDDPYSNFFCDITPTGYYKEHLNYYRILNREIVGTFKVPVVHCTYLIKKEYVDQLSYSDDTEDYEFVIFSRNARKSNIDQFICNERKFGTQVHFPTNVTLEEEIEALKDL